MSLPALGLDNVSWEIMSLNRDKLTAIPCDNGQIIGRSGPLHFIGLLLEFLELHCQLTLADFVIGEGLEMRREAEPRHGSDEPFGGVVLVPFNSVTVIHRELMMEVVISFANGYKCGDKVVTRSVFVIEWGLSEIVCKTVDAECRLGHVNKYGMRRDEIELTWWTNISRMAPA